MQLPHPFVGRFLGLETLSAPTLNPNLLSVLPPVFPQNSGPPHALQGLEEIRQKFGFRYFLTLFAWERSRLNNIL